jgi:hypothetical protein
MLNKEKWGCLLWGTLFFSPIFLCGAFFLYLGFIAPYSGDRAAADWVHLPCVINSISLRRSNSDTPDSHSGTPPTHNYNIDVSYSYQYQGKEYTSERYDFNVMSDARDEWKRAVVERLPPGTETECWVDPDNPNQAVLSRVRTISTLAAIPPTVFALVGLAGLLFTFSILLKKDPSNDPSGDNDAALESDA